MDEAINTPVFKNINLPPDARAGDLIARMTLAEKVSQLTADSAAVERLGIPAYNWWNEALHGVARAGLATVFPQAIGIAATWNEDLVHRMANAISDEARAKYHLASRNGDVRRYYGLTFWSPNTNIFRDPRWGRGQETYGEDPYLTARMGLQFVKGMQGDHPRYLKTAACAKHFAVHSGPEAERHNFNAKVSQRDLMTTYLPAFEALVKEANVAGVMGAYNRINGEPCCASHTLLQGLLREKWGFEGYVVSDYGAISDIYEGHELASSIDEAAAMALIAGCQLDSADTYEYLLAAFGKGLITEDDIDVALNSLLTIRFKLGMFDPDKNVPFTNIPIEAVNSPANQALSLEVARQSIVLLKNENHLLPLNKNLASIAVVGPNADDSMVLLGNYYGTPSETITIFEGIRGLVSPATEVFSAQGCHILKISQDGFVDAIEAAKKADAVVLVMGLSQRLEGEEGQEEGVPEGWTSHGDRETLDLPGEQEALMKALAEVGKPIVLVLLNGSALSINWADQHIPAILEAWYPGQSGGRAVAEVLFGDYNPGGRLPVTFYKSVEQLPPFEDYDMDGRTYRYFDGEALYPFGFGLSYTTFKYENLALSHDRLSGLEIVRVSCEVKNTGGITGDEVIQVYLRDEDSIFPRPKHTLVGFKRISLAPGAVEKVTFEIQPRHFAVVDDEGDWVIEPGTFTISVGGGQPGKTDCLSATLEVVGERIAVV